jgi:phosphoserine phosphatase
MNLVTPATPRQFSRAEFLQNVRDARPRTAVFDFDGTLWPGDAGSGFMHWTMATRLLPGDATKHILDRHAMYHRGEVDEIAICGEMTSIYAGLSEKVLRDSAAKYFVDHVQPHFFPEMVALVRELQESGADVWAVSSTNNWMIEEGVRELGIAPDHVLAACVVVEDGIVRETILDIPSDEGKAEALRRVGLAAPDAVFGNSVHDFHMLEMAKHPYPINPTVALAEKAAELGWPVYYPATED